MYFMDRTSFPGNDRVVSSVVMERKEPKRLVSTYVTVKGPRKFGGRSIDKRSGEEKRCTKNTAAEAAKCARDRAGSK